MLNKGGLNQKKKKKSYNKESTCKHWNAKWNLKDKKWIKQKKEASSIDTW